MNTQVSLILTKDDALRLAHELITSVCRMTGEENEHVRIHSFGHHVSAWKVDEPVVSGY